MGNSCFFGETKDNTVKLDLFYTENFAFPLIVQDNIRISSIEEIVAMKLDIIGRGGRKKDFWDIHALLDRFALSEMIDIYKKRYPYNFTNKDIKKGLINFKAADEDLDPNCLLGKYWELIKLDFEDLLK